MNVTPDLVQEILPAFCCAGEIFYITLYVYIILWRGGMWTQWIGEPLSFRICREYTCALACRNHFILESGWCGMNLYGGLSSSSSAFLSYISGVHHFWVRFLRMWPFFNPTIKVVTFRLCGWCVLGVFLLPAFTRLGHECQDLLSQCDEMHVCTD